MFGILGHLEEFDSACQSLITFQSGEAMRLAVNPVISDIRDKTLRGVGPDGTGFVQYRPMTVKQRERLGLQTSHVDLYRNTDGLIDGIHSEGSPEDGSLIVTVRDGDQAKAEGLNYGVPSKNLAPRPFLGEPGSDTMSKVEEIIAVAAEKLISKS